MRRLEAILGEAMARYRKRRLSEGGALRPSVNVSPDKSSKTEQSI
jgi:hypothetical protein